MVIRHRELSCGHIDLPAVEGAGPGRVGLRATRFHLPPRFPISPISWDLSFLSPRPPNLSGLLLCVTRMHLRGLPAAWIGAGLSVLHIHPFLSWALVPSGLQTSPCFPWPQSLLPGLETSGPGQQGRWGCAPVPRLGDGAGPGALAVMKRKRLLTTQESWKVMEGLEGASAEAGDQLNCIRKAGVGQVGRLPAPALGPRGGFGQL